MSEQVVRPGVAEHFLEIIFVLELFEVGVVGANLGILQELEHTWTEKERYEINFAFSSSLFFQFKINQCQPTGVRQ